MIKHRAQDKNERGLSVMEKLKLDFYYGREAEQLEAWLKENPRDKSAFKNTARCND